MPTLNQNIVSKDLTPYLKGDGIKSTVSLLRCVRKALTDIKKEKPCLAELEIAEISFSKDQKNGLILKVYFDNDTSPAAPPGGP